MADLPARVNNKHIKHIHERVDGIEVVSESTTSGMRVSVLACLLGNTRTRWIAMAQNKRARSTRYDLSMATE